MMTRRTLPLLVLAATCLAFPAQADCTVKYKAKQDNPLRLEAGSVTLPDAACGSEADAAAALAPLLAQQGWTLLAIVSILPAN